MLFKVNNRVLIQDREKTYLTSAALAADTSLTVASTDLAPAATSSDTWANNDYMIVGEIGHESAEIMQMSAAVTSATSLSIDRSGSAGGLRNNHPIGTPVYRIDYNRVEFSRSATDDSSAGSVLTTIRVQPDEEFTRYEDTSNSTGYGFVRFNNETSGSFSSYSDGVNYQSSGQSSSRDPRTLWSMRNKVRQNLNETSPTSKLTDAIIDDAINDKQREIAHMRLWSFYENERSFALVVNQFAYDIPSTVQKVHGVKVDTQPLVWKSKTDWDLMHWDSDQSSADPWAFTIWNNQIWLNPRPSSADSTTTLGGNVTAAATSATVASSANFNRGDYYRFIINSEIIYATASTTTTFTGLLRGQEGTTAAAHTSGDTVTERSIVYSCHVEPTDLLDTQDRTAIPEPEVVTYGAASDLAPFVGKESLIPLLEGKYKERIKELEEKYAKKQSAQFGRIKDMSEQIINVSTNRDPNRYPSSIG
jgi:hypothetical protein